MLRSNSKAVKTAVRDFIVNYLRNTDLGDEMPDASDSELVSRFRDSVLWQLRGTNYPVSDFAKVEYDLDCGGWECGSYARRMMLKEWLQESDDECWRFSND